MTAGAVSAPGSGDWCDWPGSRAPGPGCVAFFAVGSPAVSFGIALAGVAFQVWRLDRCPPAMLGRVNAGSRILTAVTIPLGALVGGTLGQLLGPRYALLVMGAGYVAFGLTLLRSPFRSERISREVLSRPH